jgi:hypothetical protein
VLAPGLTGRDANAAFAAMLQKVREVKSVRYRLTPLSPDTPEPTKRETLLAIETADGARMEIAGMVMIFRRDGTLWLDETSKTATKLGGGQDDGRARRANKPDLLQKFRDADGGMGERIDGKQFGSITTLGYRLEKKPIGEDGPEWFSMRVYIDPATDLPVRVEQEVHLSDNDKNPRFAYVLSDFEWNVEIDPSLLSLDPPVGYRSQQMTFAEPSAVADRPAAIAAGLRFYADHLQGVLPTAIEGIEPVLKLQGAVLAKLDEPARKRFLTLDMPAKLAAIKDLFGPWFGMAHALEDLDKKNTPVQYLGKGGKAGDATQIVAWWKGEKPGRAIAIYGDFSVKEIDESAAPRPATDAGR